MTRSEAASKFAVTGILPVGVGTHSLTTHHDERGRFTELYRDEWNLGVEPRQWNVVRSEPTVLRGVHVHFRHSDFFSIAAGEASIGLHDLRRGSPTFGQGAVVRLKGESMQAVSIPPGVAHGFYYHVESVHMYAVTHYWDKADELGCSYADPGLRIPWDVGAPMLSPRDAAAGTLATLMDQLERHQSAFSRAVTSST